MPVPHLNLLKSNPRKNWLLALVVLSLLGLTLIDWDAWGSDRRQEEKVALAQVPAPIAIEQEVQGGTLKDIEKTTVDGKTAYTARVVVNGNERQARIAEDGKVIGRGAAVSDDDD